jgi:hypothetical protein
VNTEIERGLLRARVLVELAWIPEAELEVARVLEHAPDSLDAWSLLAKIKHMKGELSHVIACWAGIHERSQRGARAPGSDPEIEHAMALFRERQYKEARAWCAALAAARVGTDGDGYKRAVITGAWIAGGTGDLTWARLQLEELGRERGLEHDRDRLLALVHIYDAIGTPDCLDAGAKICRHVITDLDRRGIEKLSMLGQLASLERRAGRVDVADQLDARFLEATRRRMHRASLHDLVRVGATEYLPIEQMRAVQPAGDQLPDALERRERALVAALGGELRPARIELAAGSEHLDRQYLAELAALDGDEDRAIALFLETLRDGAENPAVIGWLLERHARLPSAAIARYWTDPDRLVRTLELLHAQCELAPQRPEVWRRLAILHELAGHGDEAQRCASRAGALAPTHALPIGKVLAASVYRFAGRPKGLVHEIWAQRTPTRPGCGGTLPADEIYGNLTDEMRASVRNVFVAVREYALAWFPELTTDLNDYSYVYKLPKEDEPSGGLSAGLPSALAFLSVFLQRPISRTIVSSGMVISEAHDVMSIGRIGDAEHKVKAAYHGNLRTLILPLANRVDVVQSTMIPIAIADEIVRYAADLDQAVRLAFDADVFTCT